MMLALLATETEAVNEVPWGIVSWGVAALVLLLVALYVVTRFDPDR